MVFMIAACSADNPRLGAKSGGGRGITGLGDGTYEKLQLELNNLDLDDLKGPENDEEIEYRIEYTSERNAQFTLDAETEMQPVCKFRYKKAIIKEVVASEGSEFTITKTLTPFEAEYSGIPIQDVKERCEAAKEAKLAGAPVSRKLELEEVFKRYKEVISSEVIGLVNACQRRADVNGGRCLGLNIDIKRGLEVVFDSIIVYKISASVETPGQTHTFERVFTLNYVYFSFHGMIHKRGLSPVPGQDPSKSIESLEILTWKR